VKMIIPAAQGKPLTIINRPSLEDFFARWGYEKSNVCSVSIFLNLNRSPKWVVVIDGVGRKQTRAGNIMRLQNQLKIRI
jgi:hypothetical protein